MEAVDILETRGMLTAKRVVLVAAGVLLVAWPLTAAAQEAPAKFEVATLHVEQNATDKDAEIVMEVMGEDGLAKLTVTGPDGRTILTFAAPDMKTLGMRQFRFESPEPQDMAALKAVYPAGTYVFEGTTGSGTRLRSTAMLAYGLPTPVALTAAIANATNVPVTNLRITWTPVKGVAAYVVSLEQAELNETITVRLPGSAAAFSVPDGFLRRGKSYQLGIGTVATQGNMSFVETTFTTAEKP